MANILSKTGIQANTVIKPWHVTQSIDAFTGISAYDITLSGSLILTGSVGINGLAQQAYNRVLVIDSSTGNVAYTASGALSGSGGVTINNNTNNNLLTATGTANTLNGEFALTYDGDLLQSISNNARVYIYGSQYNDYIYLNPEANAEIVMSFASSANGKGMKLSASPTRSMLLFDSSSNFQISTVPLSTINSSPVANTYTGEQVALTVFSGSRNVQIGAGSVDTGYRLNVSGSANVSSSLTVTGSVRVTGSATVPPGTTGYALPANVYGSSPSTILGDPSAWLSIQVDGATYKLPLYN
jgi:hypothetical protein